MKNIHLIAALVVMLSGKSSSLWAAHDLSGEPSRGERIEGVISMLATSRTASERSAIQLSNPDRAADNVANIAGEIEWMIRAPELADRQDLAISANNLLL